MGAAPIWGAWADATPSDTTCGEEQQNQMRVCTGCVGACDGPGSQLATCAAGLVRLWSAWTDTAPCLVSCDKGAKRQSRECVGCAWRRI